VALKSLWADRLSVLDAEFLHVEDGIGHMHLAGACVFDGPTPAYEDIFRLVESKLHLIPRYRQRVRTVPFELARPVWADDPHFDLTYHIRHTALPVPGDDAAFCRLMGWLMSLPLDRNRPLWEAWMVEGLEGDRWAMVFKVHHCLVDGIAGVGLLSALLDIAPTTAIEEPPGWDPAPEPTVTRKVLGAWGGLLSDVAHQSRQVAGSLTHPTRAVRTVLGAIAGGARLAGDLPSTPKSTIDGAIGPHRVWVHTTVSFDDVRRIRRAFGGTVNDVVLAAVTAGFAELLRHRGEVVDEAVVRSLVPVSTRRLGADDVADNRVSLILLDLPVGIDEAVARLGAVHEAMDELKSSHMVEAGGAGTTVGDLAPPMVVGPLTRWMVRVMHRLPQRSVNTVITNVPGPQFPLYCLGHRMVSFWPYVPITHGIRVGTAVLSYDGQLSFGITGDAQTMPDIDVLARAVAAEITTMAAAADAATDTEVPGDLVVPVPSPPRRRPRRRQEVAS